MARYRILSWAGIPAQLKLVEDGGRPRSIPLPDWYAKEIDREAMRRGLAETDAYLEQWQWSPETERPGSVEEVAAEIIAEIESQWRPGRTTAAEGATTDPTETSGGET